jgi:hypothetical protein
MDLHANRVRRSNSPPQLRYLAMRSACLALPVVA